MLRSLLVVGSGLIGTSVALAARRAGLTVYLSDRDATAARVAESLGAGLARPPRERVDLAVLAVPPAAVGPVLRDLQARGCARSYTDVASVKGEPERAALRLAPDPAAYVGGHPMAGGERSGPLAASADLFAGKTWVLTPSPRTAAEALDRATRLATLCGGVPVRLDSGAHDAAVALTSHVPHLMASLTAARLHDGQTGTESLSGQGVRDVTRIAAGDPALWADIIRSNAPAVAAVLRAVRADLTALLTAVETLAGRESAVEALAGRELAVEGLAGREFAVEGLAGRELAVEALAGREFAVEGLVGRELAVEALAGRESAVEALVGRESAVEAVAGPEASERAVAERAVLDLLERGVAGHARLRAGAGPAGAGVRLRVAVGRRSGDLARLLSVAATHGARAGAVRAGPDDGELVAHLVVPAAQAAAAAAGLAAAGWPVHFEDRHSKLSPTGF